MNTLSGDSNSLHVSSMSFSNDDTNKEIIFGSGNGQIYRSTLPYRTNDAIVQVYTNIYIHIKSYS
jgi:hypothetical protein